MGKKAIEHRKKVQRRNAQIKSRQKKLLTELQAGLNEEKQKQIQAQTLRAKAVRAPLQGLEGGSTGDFIAHNYETIFKKGGQDAAQKLLDSSDTGPMFSQD